MAFMVLFLILHFTNRISGSVQTKKKGAAFGNAPTVLAQ